MSVRKLLIIFFALGVLGISILAALFSGFEIGKYKLKSYWALNTIERQLLGDYFKRLDEVQEIGPLSSIFLDLSSQGVRVPVARIGTGGGLTSFGDAVLLLTHEGKIFAARSAEDFAETAIETPDSGFGIYRSVIESEAYAHLEPRLGWFRFNDILYFESEDRRGLALSYTEFDGEKTCYRTTIAALEIDPSVRIVEQLSAVKDDWDIVYRTEPCLPFTDSFAIEGNMSGGRMTFRAPSTIYLASGDYGWDGFYMPKALAQDPGSDYGKVIAIDLATGQSRTISSGHRNMQGIVFDRNGELWVVEHGPRGGDELNRVIEGANYGWPREILGTDYDGSPVPNTVSYGRHETYRAPTFAWLPSVAISSLTLIEDFHDSWDGDILMASLRSESLFHIRIREDRVLFAEQIPIGKRIRYAHQHSDGRLVLWTDDRFLMFVTAKEREALSELVTGYIANAKYGIVKQTRVRKAINRCLECHSFEPEDDLNAPSLAAVFEAPIGTRSFAGYSGALRDRDGVWSREALLSFLQDPEVYAPGTSMPDPEINDVFILGELINLLALVAAEGSD